MAIQMLLSNLSVTISIIVSNGNRIATGIIVSMFATEGALLNGLIAAT